jgi:hypothetical protein
MSLIGDRTYFFRSHPPVRRAFENIARVKNALWDYRLAKHSKDAAAVHGGGRSVSEQQFG